MHAQRFLKGVFCAMAVALSWHTLAAQQVDVIEHTLDNGLQILMVQRPGDPSVTGGWVAHVGSVNERPGITGIAHLFEHMMFKGTHTIGTQDIQEDLRILAAKDSIRALMRQEESRLREMQRRGAIENHTDPEHWTPRYRELQDEFQTWIERQREVIIKDELDRIYTNAGGSGLNAFTSHDLTFYFVTVPSNRIELFFWMESDRLLNPVFREFYAERDVVREERRLRIDSTPTGKFDETFEAMFYAAHPYGWPVIGWPSDVENITREQANEFYDIFYSADNITFVFAGDLDPENIITLSEKYLARLPRAPRPISEVITEEIPQEAEKRMIAYAETNPTVRIRYHTVPFNHQDDFALNVLGGVLSGRTGRLHRDLVLERDIAIQAGGGQVSRKYNGFFQFTGVVKEGHTPEEVEQEIYRHIERLREEPISQEELQRVKNRNLADSYRRLGNNMFLMVQLGMYESMDTWEYINQQSDRIQAVTAEDIQHVVNRYFDDDQRTVAIYYTKDADAPVDPELAELPQQIRAQATQARNQIRQADDADQLRAMLEQMRGASGQVTDEEQQKFLNFMIRSIEQRLEELEGSD